MDKQWSRELEKLTQQMTRQIVNPYLTLETVELYAREDYFTYQSLKERNRILEKRKVFEREYPLEYETFVRKGNLEFEMGNLMERAFYRIHLLRIREEYEKNRS
jgi:hypothetical protein